MAIIMMMVVMIMMGVMLMMMLMIMMVAMLMLMMTMMIRRAGYLDRHRMENQVKMMPIMMLIMMKVP